MARADSPYDDVVTPYMKIWVHEQILYCRYAENLVLSLDIAKACVDARMHFCKGKSYPVIVDMRGLKSATKEARTYLANAGTALVQAGALITGSTINMALGNLFLTIDKPPIPTKLFTNEEKAKQWVKNYLQVI